METTHQGQWSLDLRAISSLGTEYPDDIIASCYYRISGPVH